MKFKCILVSQIGFAFKESQWFEKLFGTYWFNSGEGEYNTFDM